ncbi:MAG: PAS domain-containing protein, partial [Candidatus Cloacimonetes bacterium]|nr:PAS domain-containing protein [Candidatus Cloacimonadota bacterium]
MNIKTDISEIKSGNPINYSIFLNISSDPAACESILKYIPVGAFITNSKLRVCYWNQVMEDTIGLTPGQVEKKGIFDILPILDQPPLHKALDELRDSRVPILAEPFHAADRNLKYDNYYFKFTLIPVIDDHSRLQNIIFIAEDTTRKSLAEEQLATQHKLLQNITDAAPMCIFINQVEPFLPVWVNDEISNLLGYTPEEWLKVTQSDFFKMLHRDDTSYVQQRVKELLILPIHQIMEMEFRIRHKSEKWIWLYYKSIPFKQDNRGFNEQIISTAIDTTDRKSAIEALIESEFKFKMLLDAAPFGMLILDKEDRFKYINGQFTKITGYTSLEINEVKPFSTFLLQETSKQKENYECYEKGLESGGVDGIETEFYHQSGEIRIIQLSVRHLPDKRKLISCIDITERKQAVDNLRESEERFRSIANNIPGVVFKYTVDKNLERKQGYRGPGFEDIVGDITASMVEGNIAKFFELIFPEDYASLQEASLKAESTTSILNHEYRVNLIEGGFRWVRTICRPKLIENETTEWLGVIFDTTESKQATQALQESEKRFRQIIENASEIIYRADVSGKILFVNPTTVRLVEYSEQELLSMNYLDIIRKDYHKQVLEFYSAQVDNHTTTTNLEFPLVTKSGKHLWVDQNVRLIYQDD